MLPRQHFDTFGVWRRQPTTFGPRGTLCLARIVGRYDELSDIELFVHETDLQTAQGRLLLQVTNVSSAAVRALRYLPLHTDDRILKLNYLPSWSLVRIIRRLYTWALLNADVPYNGAFATQCCGAPESIRSVQL